MKQVFKSIYLPGQTAGSSTQRHIRLAFGQKEQHLYDRIQYLSSEQIRQLLGIDTFDKLSEYAGANALSINRACISLLHKMTQTDVKSDISSPPNDLFTDPLIATYRGGNGDPLHGWFALLEGYSPRFVKTVLQLYAPHAKTLFDPFGGVGTSPLTAANLGLNAWYCEINPALQLVIEAKYRVLRLKADQREKLIGNLQDLAFQVGFQLHNYKADDALLIAYNSTFAGSKFFDDDTLALILKMRTFVDELSAENPLLGLLFSVAIISSLVPASLMVRKGDLRYKTPAEQHRSNTNILVLIANSLTRMASDIKVVDIAPGTALLVAQDAQSVAYIPRLGIDCIVTSPPYLNGTNYFRNTKIELWFLRVLSQPSDLSYLRSKAFTAGINDVTKSKCDQPYPPELDGLLEKINESAYDIRIPMMIASYFREFNQLFQSLTRHLNKGAIVAIDIGDSKYGGVHVETDKYISLLAAKHGYRETATSTLRVRKSPDGALLRQVLLIYEYQGRAVSSSSHQVDSLASSNSWVSFKANLPHQAMPFNKRNWGHELHSLCSYGGKLKPSIAHFLSQIFVPDKGAMLDPFAGVGTIPFEASLQGKRAYGFEISPSAFAIASSKVQRPLHSNVESVLLELEQYLSSHHASEQDVADARLINFNRELSEYYNDQTFGEILVARRFFSVQGLGSIESNFVLACLLHILHGNRPYALSRRSHPITPFAPTGTYEYRSLIPRLRAKVNRSLDVDYPDNYVDGRILMQDATACWPLEIQDIDAIITSPPFFDSTRFYLQNWIRLWFCGWERKDFSDRPQHFLESRQQQSMSIYEPIFRQARERLKRDGVLVMHLGKSKKCNMGEQLIEVAKPWFNKVDLFEENVTHCESHGIRDKGTVAAHQYLILG